jgi:hypothetical protein
MAQLEPFTIDGIEYVTPWTEYKDDSCPECAHTWHGMKCKYCPCSGPYNDSLSTYELTGNIDLTLEEMIK